MSTLPIVRSHERITKKRCPKKWYWAWRKGLVLRTTSFGALDLGTWVHNALANWYGSPAKQRRDVEYLAWLFGEIASQAINAARIQGAPEHHLEAAEKLYQLGHAMMLAYAKHYGPDANVRVIKAEIPLEFIISDDAGQPIAKHRLKPDLLYRDEYGFVWLMEHKTAATIRTEHLVIDDQARPYGAMAELALRKVGAIEPHEKLRGIMYNFLRKATPDDRETDAEGYALNKNGTVSKRQPVPLFLRHPVRLSARAKAVTLRRIQRETIEITNTTLALRSGALKPEMLSKTPHSSCPKFCDYFKMCELEEEGADIREMQRSMYKRVDPYVYEEDTTDDPISFEMG